MAEKELVELLGQLVAIPSVNPECTDDASIAGEGRLADFLAGLLEGLGFRITWHDRASGRPNLVAFHGPGKPRRTLLLASHLDTVGVTGMTRPPFEAQVEGGRLYARGACDTKGPMAAALHAFSHETLEALAAAGYGVMFAAVMGEETGNVGAARLARSGLRVDQVIVLEPTELAVIHAHKGALWFEVEVRGTAAHGSNPEHGVNAIVGMAEVLRVLQEQIKADQQARRNPLLGSPSLSVGAIRGGSAVNVVPDRCVIQVDRRTLPEEDHQQIIERVRAGLVQLEREGRILSHQVRIMKAGAPFQTSASSRLVEALKTACTRAGVKPRTEGAAWYSDAGPLSDICSEIVVFGPGSIQQAHTADEYIDLGSLQAGCEVIRRLLRQLAEKEP